MIAEIYWAGWIFFRWAKKCW